MKFLKYTTPNFIFILCLLILAGCNKDEDEGIDPDSGNIERYLALPEDVRSFLSESTYHIFVNDLNMPIPTGQAPNCLEDSFSLDLMEEGREVLLTVRRLNLRFIRNCYSVNEMNA